MVKHAVAPAQFDIHKLIDIALLTLDHLTIRTLCIHFEGFGIGVKNMIFLIHQLMKDRFFFN